MLKGVAKLGIGTCVASAFQIAATPVVAMLYSPNAFGASAAWLSLSSIIGSIAPLRLDTAITLPKEESIANRLFCVSVFFTLINCLFFGGVIILLWLISMPGPWLNLGKYTFLIPLGAVGISLSAIMFQWLARMQAVQHLIRFRIITNLATSGLQIIFGVFGSGLMLIFSDILGRFVGIGSQRTSIKNIFNHGFSKNIRNELIEIFHSYKSHALWLTPSALVDTLGQQIPTLLIIAWYGESVGGKFSFTQRLLSLPLMLIGQSVSQLFYPNMVNSYRICTKHSLKLFITMSSGLLLISVALVAVVFSLEEQWIIAVIGEKWTGLGSFLRPLSILAGAQLLGGTLSQTAIVVGAHKKFSLWIIFWVLLSISGMIIGGKTNSSLGAVWGLTIGSGGAYIILWVGLLVGLFKINCKT